MEQVALIDDDAVGPRLDQAAAAVPAQTYANPVDIDYRYNFEQVNEGVSYRTGAIVAERHVGRDDARMEQVALIDDDAVGPRLDQADLLLHRRRQAG
jgi:hypothetical protein